jgi:hypothetical protein
MTENEIISKAQEIWRQRRLLVWAGALAIGAIGLVALVAYPSWQRSDTWREDQNKSSKILAALQQRTKTVTTLPPEQAKLFSLADIGLPLQKQPLLVIQAMQRIAADAGVDIKKYDLSPGIISTDAASLAAASSVGAAAAANRQNSMNITLEVVGTLDQLHQTLSNMENSLPLFDVVDMSILPVRSGDDVVGTARQFRVTMQVRTFYANFDPVQLAKGGAQPLTGAQLNMQKKLQALRVWTITDAASSSGIVNTADYKHSDLFGTDAAPAPTPTPTPTPTP